MAIIAKREGGKDFKPAPEGQWPAVCCDAVDMGMVKVTFENKTMEKHKARLVFMIPETDPDFDDKQFIVSATFNLTMHEKGRLRPFLESWRGKKYTDKETDAGVDIEKMVGVDALIQIVHNTGSNGKTYANVDSIMRLPKGMEKVVNDGYTRVKDREETDNTDSDATSEAAKDGYDEMPEGLDESDDLPF